MFGKVFHFNVAEVADACMESKFCELYVTEFEMFHERLAEVHASRWGCYCAFTFGEDSLIVLCVFRLNRSLDFDRQWSVA